MFQLSDRFTKGLRFFLLGILMLAITLFVGRWVYSKLFTTQTWTEGVIGQPQHINPLLAKGSPVDRTLVKLVYRGLIQYNEQLQPVSDLAKSWTVSEDNRTYTVTLKPNQVWEDNKPITADDVIFTYQKMPEFQTITIKKIDTLTVEFTLKQAFSPFLELLTTGILPVHKWQGLNDDQLKTDELNLKPIGSGGYRVTSLETEQDRVRSITLQAVSKTKQPAKIIFIFYDSQNNLVSAYQLGQIDAFASNKKAVADTFRNWKNTHITEFVLNGLNNVIFFNLRDDNSPVAEVTLRRSLAKKIANAGNLGDLQGPIPKEHWGYSAHHIIGNDTNLESISLKLQHLKTPELLSKISNDWNEAQLEISETEALPKGTWDVFIAQQQIGHDPDQYVYWHSTQTKFEEGGLNISGYKNRRVDKALEDARKLRDTAKRKEAYDVFQRWLAEEVPAIFLERPRLYYITRQNIPRPEKRSLWDPSERLD